MLNWTIKVTTPEHRAYDGILIERQEVEYTIPFACGSIVYYVHRKSWWKARSPFVVTKCAVTGAWATNTFGIILDGDNHIAKEEFDHIFTDRDSAIEYCIKKNEHRKIKIYGE